MFALALMIISTVIGAGFATGAELIAYFGDSTLPPFWVAVITGVFHFLIMSVLTLYCSRTKTHAGVSEKFKNNKLIYGMSQKSGLLMGFVYFVFLMAMIAGIAELGGVLIAAAAVVLCACAVWFGFERTVTINKYIMTFALVILFFVSCGNLNGTIAKTNLPLNILSTLFKGILYAGLNCCMLKIVFERALEKRSRGEVLISSAFAALVISFFVLIILTAIKSNNVRATMPVLAMSDNFFTMIAILISIFTSMYAAMLGISNIFEKQAADEKALDFQDVYMAATNKLNMVGQTLDNQIINKQIIYNNSNNKTTDKQTKNNKVAVIATGISTTKKAQSRAPWGFIITIIAAYIVSFFGFTNIIAVFYPLVSAGMLVYILIIFSWQFYCAFRRIRAR